MVLARVMTQKAYIVWIYEMFLVGTLGIVKFISSRISKVKCSNC